MSDTPTEPGVYFSLEESAYHAIPALSSSGIKWLAISTMDFWARCPWLNPAAEEMEESEFQELGSAYHARILEGRQVFYQRYAAALRPEDYPAALRTADDLRAALKELGIKTGGNKRELTERLREAAPEILIWDEKEREHQEFHAGKILLHPDSISRIEIAAAMIENHPDLSRCFQGGAPEVSVVWEDEETGVPCKARFDYLKTRAACDLKTFSNPLGKSVDEAIYQSIAGRKYYVQAAHYLDAIPQMKRFAKEGRVFGNGPSDLLGRLADEPQWVWIFQQTGVAPLARGKVFAAGMVRDIGKITARDARAKYRECLERFSTDPWVDTAPIESLDDSMFPAWLGR